MVGVSIALATYNGAKYIAEQLRSIADQTRLPDELVVCDDGSTDETLDIVRSFASGVPFPVSILENPKTLGHADNFLKAAALCRHDLVAYCDQDDVWLPEKLDILSSRIIRDGSLAAVHKATVTDEKLSPQRTIEQGIDLDAIPPPLTIFPHYGIGWGMTMMFRREILDLIPTDRRPRSPWKERLIEHDIWTYLIASSLGTISHIDRSLILYRQHDNNSEGSRRSPLGQQVKSFFTVPMHRHIGNQVFYEQVSACFSAIKDPRFVEQARLASQVYEAKSMDMSRRIKIYTAESISARMRHFSAHLRSGDASLPSQLKDFCLGVLKIGVF